MEKLADISMFESISDSNWCSGSVFNDFSGSDSESISLSPEEAAKASVAKLRESVPMSDWHARTLERDLTSPLCSSQELTDIDYEAIRAIEDLYNFWWDHGSHLIEGAYGLDDADDAFLSRDSDFPKVNFDSPVWRILAPKFKKFLEFRKSLPSSVNYGVQDFIDYMCDGILMSASDPLFPHVDDSDIHPDVPVALGVSDLQKHLFK